MHKHERLPGCLNGEADGTAQRGHPYLPGASSAHFSGGKISYWPIFMSIFHSWAMANCPASSLLGERLGFFCPSWIKVGAVMEVVARSWWYYYLLLKSFFFIELSSPLWSSGHGDYITDALMSFEVLPTLDGVILNLNRGPIQREGQKVRCIPPDSGL